jgi:hypothetical protein
MQTVRFTGNKINVLVASLVANEGIRGRSLRIP